MLYFIVDYNPRGGQISKQNPFMSGAAITQKLSQNQKSKKKSKKWKENGSKESKYMGFKWIWFCEINQNKSNWNQK